MKYSTNRNSKLQYKKIRLDSPYGIYPKLHYVLLSHTIACHHSHSSVKEIKCKTINADYNDKMYKSVTPEHFNRMSQNLALFCVNCRSIAYCEARSAKDESLRLLCLTVT